MISVWGYGHTVPMANDHLLQGSVDKKGDIGDGGGAGDTGEASVAGDGGEASDSGEGAESELERSNETMQRLLNIMAKYLEGEVIH